ncbi:MAG: DUF2845 domain-containing protein [Odoribacter sp.]|nr:DUF2845 domain-containing protein [Odoribacter sp.]
MRLATTAITVAMVTALSSCFTGIESTPRITAGDVRNAGADDTPEQSFGNEIAATAPAQWLQGKQWLVDDNKISIIFNPPTADSLAGRILTLNRIQATTTVMGKQAADIILDGPYGHSYCYSTGIEIEEFNRRASFEIPFTVEMSPVMTADSIMRGKTYYINTPAWRDLSGRHEAEGLRHVPITVTGVIPGTASRPLKVIFTHAGDSTPHCVLLTFGSSPSSTRNFDRVFSFNDPRRLYPRITDEIWENIIHSQVSEGMTRDECRLALGTPATLRRGATTGAQIEHWSYDNGTYLIFEDGILTRFRK